MSDTSSAEEKNQNSLGHWHVDLMKSLVFLTRIPVKLSDEASHAPLNRAMRAFPLIGFVIGLIAVIIGLVVQQIGFSDWMAAIIMVLVLVKLTGALHEDGLGDVADGFYGGADKDKKLAIMRDSRLGTYGTLALIFSIFLRVAALASFEDFAMACMALIGVACLSRLAPFAMIYTLDPARTDGLAADLEKPQSPHFWQGFGLAAALFLLFVPFHAGIWALVASGVVFYLFANNCRHHIDGHTGDTCGASQQIVEIIALLVLAAFL